MGHFTISNIFSDVISGNNWRSFKNKIFVSLSSRLRLLFTILCASCHSYGVAAQFNSTESPPVPDPAFVRTGLFVVKLEGYQRLDKVLKVLHSVTITHCGHECLQLTDCAGFTFGREVDFSNTECYVHRGKEIWSAVTSSSFNYYELKRDSPKRPGL